MFLFKYDKIGQKATVIKILEDLRGWQKVTKVAIFNYFLIRFEGTNSL